MSKWYLITTNSQIYTDYVVWADNERDAQNAVFDGDYTHEGDDYGFNHEKIIDVEELDNG